LNNNLWKYSENPVWIIPNRVFILKLYKSIPPRIQPVSQHPSDLDANKKFPAGLLPPPNQSDNSS